MYRKNRKLLGILQGSHFCFLLLAVIVLILSGCALVETGNQSKPISVVEPKPIPQLAEKGWWQAGFRIRVDEESEPLWHVDLLLAHGVISPVLKEFDEEIVLWRFHRRAKLDKTGHFFRFLLFSSPETAQKIFAAVKESDLLKKAKSAGIIIEETYDDTSQIRKPEINDTSDPIWSMITQKAWPYYIMGVSRMWLSMIENIIEENPPQENLESMDQVEEYYKQVNASITRIWQEEGQHAFLHHLNALFGYEPTMILEQRFFRF